MGQRNRRHVREVYSRGDIYLMIDWAVILQKVAGIIEAWEDSGYSAKRSGRFVADGVAVDITRDLVAKTVEVVIREASTVEELRG